MLHEKVLCNFDSGVCEKNAHRLAEDSSLFFLSAFCFLLPLFLKANKHVPRANFRPIYIYIYYGKGTQRNAGTGVYQPWPSDPVSFPVSFLKRHYTFGGIINLQPVRCFGGPGPGIFFPGRAWAPMGPKPLSTLWQYFLAREDFIYIYIYISLSPYGQDYYVSNV